MTGQQQDKPDADNLIPAKDIWEFDAHVTEVFDAMLVNSIPAYAEMRRFTDMFIRRQLRHLYASRGVLPGWRNPVVVDLGASRGEATARAMAEFPDARYTLIETSEPMRASLQERYGHRLNISITDLDLRYRHADLATLEPDLVVCVLTTIFTPISYRQAILASVRAALPQHGMFLWVEKIQGSGPAEDEMLTREYYQFKADNGYTEEAILRKKLSLELVQTPLTAEWNEDMLKRAGFGHIQRYWQALNFAGWVCTP